MTPERWKQIDSLLQEALDLAPLERAAFLSKACAGDEELRREVESPLGFHERADEFIEEPPADVAASWQAKSESRTGQTLGHYRVIKQIGRGGMGEVYLARDTRLDRPVALKLLPQRFTEDDLRVQRFRQEARAVSALNHPNIMTIHEVGEISTEAGKVHFIATEYIEGRTLRDLIHGGGMRPNEAIEVALQVTDALAAAHAAGIIHRDIKPENVMLRPDGYVKVLDFGLAKLDEQPAETTYPRRKEVDTDPGIVLGTVSYMSPEQARGLETDARSDIFSLGVLLYEMVTSHQPFDGATQADVVAALVSGEPRPLAEFVPNARPALQRLIKRTLAKEPTGRYKSADDLRRALKALKNELTPEDAYSTREFSGLSLLADRFFDSGARPTHKTSADRPAGSGRATSRFSLLITRIMRSPGAVSLTLIGLAILIVGAFVVWKWLTGGTGKVESLAVLPFKPLVADARDEALEMGLADTLITRLSSLNGLTVRPMSAVRRYTALDQDPIAAGAAVQAQAVLDSSIQKHGDSIRVSSRLINVASGRVIWAGQFNEKWTSIFAVQDAISSRVADDLIEHLSKDERTELARNYTADPAAYRHYLEGRYHWGKRTSDGMRKSIEYFEQAIQKDPQYALAYVGLADANATLATYRVMAASEVMPRAREAAERAVSLDRNLAEAHASLGKILTDYEWNWEGAEREFQLAISLKPNYANGHHWYSTLLAHLGRFDEAIREANRAVELDYLSPAASTQLGSVLYRARRYDQAKETLRKTLEREPNHLTAILYLGICDLVQGNSAEALGVFLKARALAPNNVDLIALLGHAYAKSGNIVEARKCENQLIELEKQTYVSPFARSAIPRALGDLDEGFKWLERCFEQNDPSIRSLKTDPLFDGMRHDPRFAVLLKRARVSP